MRIALRFLVIAVPGLLAVLLAAVPTSAGPKGDEMREVVSFTVDNPSDIGDANPGDGRCEITTGDTSEPADLRTTPTVPTGGKTTPFKTIPTLYPPITEPPTSDEAGLCTLRAAVHESNAVPETIHLVTLPAELGVYHLTGGQLPVVGRIRLQRDLSDGSKRSAINAGHRSRIFYVAPGGRLHVDGMFLSQGSPASGRDGGAILVSDGAYAKVRRSVVVNNHGNRGGAIFVASGGRFDTHYTSYESNVALLGGAIYADGNVELEQTSVYNNRAEGSGGGLFINTQNGGNFWMRHSSILDNVAARDGGGLYKSGPRSIAVRYSTIAGNSAAQGGGLFIAGETALIADSIVADNSDMWDPWHVDASPDCAGPVRNGGAINLFGVVSPACQWSDIDDDLTGTIGDPLDPGLEPIRISTDANRYGDGGELAYRRPTFNSPALDVIPADRCRIVRDMIRVNVRVRVPCDLGAIER